MMETNGAMRVWWGRGFADRREMEYVPVASLDEAVTTLNRLADSDLRSSIVLFNMSGLEVVEDGEWQEWCTDDGDDIWEYADRLDDDN
jgi:hypothetical protein